MNKHSLSDIANILMGQSPKGDTCNNIGIGKPLLNGPTEFGDFFPIAKQYTTEGNKFSAKGDILFCVRGSTTGRMNWSDKEYVLGRGLASIRHKKGEKLNHFLKYLIEINLDSILKLTSGSTFPNLTSDMLNTFKVVLPDVSIQTNINDFLKSLDSKIELNNRINAELEAMAKTLYDYWFVQFDFPDANGKPYKSSGGKMVWNEELKREIPEGWEVENIEKCCSIVDCLHSKKSDLIYEAEQYYLLQLENINDNGLIDLNNKYYVTKAEYQKWISRIEVVEDDILITNAGRVAATAQIPKGIKTGIGRNITAIRPNSINPTYLFLAFRGLDMVRQIKWNTDSGAFFTSLNVKGIKKLFIARPPCEIENQFEKLVQPIRQKREINNVENQQLSEFRDWLLPMLMNGQVTVGGKEKCGLPGKRSAGFGGTTGGVTNSNLWPIFTI